jgi:AraC-like DNA-binding protein
MNIQLTQKIRERSKKVTATVQKYGRLAIRKLATKVGCSKSAVHRHLQAQERRNLYPESRLWETEEGQAWLRLLIFGSLYMFGLQRHVGTEHLSAFFKLIRLDTHVGISPSALAKLLQRMEALLPEFQRMCEAQQSDKKHKAVLSGDETFFGELMILVLMDLPSGYLLLEESANDRSFNTWLNKAKPRLEELGIEVKYAVTDRAKALIKLALNGFGCDSGADLFHALSDVSKSLGLAFHRAIAKAEQKVQSSIAKLESLKKTSASKAEIDAQVQCVGKDDLHHYMLEKGHKDYRETLQSVSDTIHPFTLEDSKAQASAEVEKRLAEKAQKLEETAWLHDIEDRQERVNKFRNQCKALSSGVDVWWVWALESLSIYALGKEKVDWLLYTLLPVFYWHRQMEKTDNPSSRKQYKTAWERALAALQSHPLTPMIPSEELKQWQGWAEWMAVQFHRSSSAVEGRNGCLSQMYHNGRGLTVNRLQACTVIHNFGIKRANDTTAAERFFGTQFPDLFEWLVGQMGELPLPRKGRTRSISNPLNLQAVPL